jgi:hypothetical protein
VASIHRQPGRPFWFCAFTEFDPQTNRAKRVFRSTKTSDRKQALEICRAWQKAALLARNGKLSVHLVKYWEIIANRLKKVGWSLGWVSALDSKGRTVWIVVAHRDPNSVSFSSARTP